MTESDIERYKRMLEEDPGSRAFAPLAEAYRKAGKLDDAIRTALAGLDIHPGYTSGMVVLGRAYYEKGELDRAAEVLRRAVRDTPESYLGQKFLGKVLLDRGELNEALRALEAANLLSPEDEEVARLLEEVRRRAAPAETMDFEEDERTGEGPDEGEIITYDQKPVTVDGVELDPLPPVGPDETFSFAPEDGATAEPAPVPPAGPATPPDAVTGLDGLGQEAEEFIREAEEVEAELEVSVEEIFPEITPEEVMDLGAPKEEEAEADGAAPPNGLRGETTAAAVEPAPPVSEPSPEPPATAAESPESLPEAPTAPAMTPETASASGAPISTETLVDLYARQGLRDKAAEIYRRILDERPGDEAVLLKLRALQEEQQAAPEGRPLPDEPSGGKTPEGHDPVAVLERWLSNAERMKRK